MITISWNLDEKYDSHLIKREMGFQPVMESTNYVSKEKTISYLSNNRDTFMKLKKKFPLLEIKKHD